MTKGASSSALKPSKLSKGESQRGGFEAPSTEGFEAPLQLAKVKGASKPSKGQRSPFSLSLEGFEAFLFFEAFKAPFVLLLKPSKASKRALKPRRAASQHLFGFIFFLSLFLRFSTSKSVVVCFLLFSFGENVGF